MNFEVIDNLFQVAAMSSAAIAAIVLALRYKTRHFLILVLAYASFAMGANVYLAVFHLQSGRAKKLTDVMMIASVLLQLSVYTVSGFMEDFTRFNLYFAVDIALTLTLLSILPLTVQKVTRK